jgi:UDP-glucose 4-epimerase
MDKKIKTVLITGGTGSFGKTALMRLLDAGVEQVRVFSRDEEKQDALHTELREPRIKYYIGDIRDRESVERAMRGVQCVFHAAALKQVPSCEFFPMEAIRTNIMGSENVVRSAMKLGIENLVCLSTDKAVFPVNVMGMSKAMMEKIAQAGARELGPDSKTTISCVRYGNVMYSRGSVIPLFIKQIKSGKPMTVTEPKMTRFLMPLRDSVSLVQYAFENANQGDLFIQKAPAATVIDLVNAIKELFGVPDYPVDIIGPRHAEKLHETLASAHELANSDDLGKFFRIHMDKRDLNYQTLFEPGKQNIPAIEDFDSHNAQQLDVQATKELLISLPEVQAEVEAYKNMK